MKHTAQFLQNDPVQVPPNAESIPSQELLNHNFPEIMGAVLIKSHPTPRYRPKPRPLFLIQCPELQTIFKCTLSLLLIDLTIPSDIHQSSYVSFPSPYTCAFSSQDPPLPTPQTETPNAQPTTPASTQNTQRSSIAPLPPSPNSKIYAWSAHCSVPPTASWSAEQRLLFRHYASGILLVGPS
ncbi:uncharacterized protein K444DRAFT_611850 [Hyaloscypha bicolor E]|uniref:Uncharacterized protein n=1 Tax=Hyaloscypha bicolor E TaxID=1095630 RepID=A0A2J6TF07_9HELO|nr:uncharacterized protein K444DRAFT_611850 [Hyaloscypha bicolor E]PMD61611.1 hypothetical protein K444DRAFT_611850 [Hyaloscypha bicolor E]